MKRIVDKLMIGAHCIDCIAYGAANIERCPRRFTNPAIACKNAMSYLVK
jgi:hypothetical protein